MAEPRRQPRAEASTVSSCGATDCVHNEERSCHAGSIRVELSSAGHATCKTYETERTPARP